MSIGGTPLSSANLLYVGLLPGTPGLYQINIRVPDLPNGDHEILMGNAPPEGFITITNQ